MPPSTAAAADAAADALRRAIAAGQDAEAARLLRLLEADGAQLPPATFVELAAAGLPQAAVALAQLESGVANLREATDDGGSYLHAAAAAGAGAAVVAALVAAGCAINGGDANKATALHLAARESHLDTCRALIEAGADALVRNCHGRTARAQAGVSADIKALLEEAEAAGARRRAEAQGRLFNAKMRATQTESACRLGCV